MSGNRLGVLARRAAPIQVAHMGYPATTGLRTIDYRISDVHLDPPGDGNDPDHERPVQLPDSFWCYAAPDAEAATNALPAIERGYITFGCLNNPAKFSPFTLDLWSALLRQMNAARLLLLSPQASRPILHLVQAFSQRGVSPDRIRFAPVRPQCEYLRHYHEIDIALDSLPYNGHSTSLDACWMGVPVITLCGKTSVGRGGVSILANLSLKELIASTPQEYLDLASTLANDLPRLRDYRLTLRRRMLASPLMDPVRYTKNLESAFRHVAPVVPGRQRRSAVRLPCGRRAYTVPISRATS